MHRVVEHQAKILLSGQGLTEFPISVSCAEFGPSHSGGRPTSLCSAPVVKPRKGHAYNKGIPKYPKSKCCETKSNRKTTNNNHGGIQHLFRAVRTSNTLRADTAQYPRKDLCE